MSKDIIEDLQWRYTTKRFNPNKRISQSDLDIIYNTLRLSPSSINSQPWKFIVISSQEARKKMADTFLGDTPASNHPTNKKHIFTSSQIILFAYNPQYSKNDFEKVVDKYIKDKRIQLEDKEKAFNIFSFVENKKDVNHWAKSQLYIALGNVLHTLGRLRIDSTPMEGINPKLIESIFKNELNGFKCDLALVIGYRDDSDYNAKSIKSRLDLEDIIHTI